MTTIETNRAEDFIRSLKHKSVHLSKYGNVVRMEERIDSGSHIGKSINIHPGRDTLDCCLLDLKAICEDEGVIVVKN